MQLQLNLINCLLICSTEPDVLIIQAKLYEKLNNFAQSIEKLNQAIVLYPKFLPALIEKIRLHSALKEFEALTDTCFRTLSIDKHCIDPQRYLILYYLAWKFSEELVGMNFEARKKRLN